MHLQLVAFNTIAVFPGQVFLQKLQPRLLELQDLAAPHAPQVAVVGVPVNVLIVPVAVVEIHLPDQTAVNEQRQGAVNGGLGYLRAFVPEPPVEFLHIEMSVNLKNLSEYLFPFRGAPQMASAEIFPEHLDFRFHHRTRIRKGLLLRISCNNIFFPLEVKEIFPYGGACGRIHKYLS
jgi:hypothetical protein